MNNRFWNAKNPNQGEAKKVLCVCSAGLLRSPTMAVVLGGEPYNFNTRAAGVDAGHALIPVDSVLLHWADEIVCSSESVAKTLKTFYPLIEPRVLNIPDNFAYRDPELMKIIKEQYDERDSSR